MKCDAKPSHHRLQMLQAKRVSELEGSMTQSLGFARYMALRRFPLSLSSRLLWSQYRKVQLPLSASGSGINASSSLSHTTVASTRSTHSARWVGLIDASIAFSGHLPHSGYGPAVTSQVRRSNNDQARHIATNPLNSALCFHLSI